MVKANSVAALALLAAFGVTAAHGAASAAGGLAAVVEAVEAGAPEVGELETLQEGQVVALAQGDRVVLGYLDNCALETVSGPGLVRVGRTGSTAEGGASVVDSGSTSCQGVAQSGLGQGNGAALRLRSLGKPRQPEPPPAASEAGATDVVRAMRDRQAPGAAPHRHPVLVLDDPEPYVTLEPLGGQGDPRRIRARAPMVDTEGATDPLEPGRWLARRGEAVLVFEVGDGARGGRASRGERLVRF